MEKILRINLEMYPLTLLDMSNDNVLCGQQKTGQYYAFHSTIEYSVAVDQW